MGGGASKNTNANFQLVFEETRNEWCILDVRMQSDTYCVIKYNERKAPPFPMPTKAKDRCLTRVENHPYVDRLCNVDKEVFDKWHAYKTRCLGLKSHLVLDLQS